MRIPAWSCLTFSSSLSLSLFLNLFPFNLFSISPNYLDNFPISISFSFFLFSHPPCIQIPISTILLLSLYFSFSLNSTDWNFEPTIIFLSPSSHTINHHHYHHHHFHQELIHFHHHSQRQNKTLIIFKDKHLLDSVTIFFCLLIILPHYFETKR